MTGVTSDSEPAEMPESLRREAEARLRATGAVQPLPQDEDSGRLAHELQVHRAALEVQIEVLRRTQQELNALQQRHIAYFDLAPIGYLGIGADGAIREANAAAATLLGADRTTLLGQPLSHFLVREDQAISCLHQRDMFANESRQILEMRVPSDSEMPRWLRVEATVAPPRDGAAPVCYVALSDISERKQTVQEVAQRRELQERLEMVVTSTPGMIYAWQQRPDGTSCMPYASPVIADLFGLQPQDVANDATPIYANIHPDDVKRVADSITASAVALSNWHDHFRYLHPLKGECWIEGWSVPRLEPDGSILWQGYAQDITARKHAEDALRDSEERYRTAFRTSPDAININGLADGLFIDVNEGFERMTGWTRAEILGKTSLETGIWRDPADRQRLLDALQRDGLCEDLEARFGMRDGRELVGLMSARKIMLGGTLCILSITRDITDRKQAEAALRRSEADLARAQTIAHVGSWRFDTHSGQLTWSEEACRIFELDAVTAMTMKDFLGCVHAEDQTRVGAAIEAGLAGAEYDIEYRIHAGNQIKWVRAVGEVNRDSAGRPLTAVGSVQDITGRKRTEEQLRKLSLAVEQSPESILITDLEGNIDYVNEAFVRKTGYRRDEVLGQNPRVLHSGNTPPQTYAALWETLRQGKIWQGEFKNRRKDGSEYIDYAIITPIRQPDGHISHYVAVQEDISEKKRIGEELDRHRHHLEELVIERTAQLADARERAEAANRAKSSFLANMSHEIRTPLNAVLGLAQVGARENAGRKSGDTFERIHDSGRLLLGIVDDILDFSKIEAGKLQLEHLSFGLGAVIDRALQASAESAYVKGLALTLDEAPDLPVRCMGDALRLSQVLVNLLSNAVKFTERGAIRLSVLRDGGQLLFRVADTGIGMTPEQTARLFASFEQADSSTTRRFGGTGLGLVISKRLAELMGAEIRVDSRLGEGSVFELCLPLTPVADPAPASCGPIVLSGLAEEESRALRDALAARAVPVSVVTLAHAFDKSADLVVLDSASLSVEGVVKAAGSARRGGRHLALIVTPGTHQDIPHDLRDVARIIERPLRARQVIAAARQSGTTSGAAEPRLSGLRVLAAEDNEVNQLVLTEMLSREGAHLRCVANGRLAVERIQEDGALAWDIVLMDIQMPVMDGYEAARRIRALAPELSVVGLTAHAMAEERERCLAAGMVEHLAKPIDADALTTAILRHARRRPQVRENGNNRPASDASPAPPVHVAGPALVDWVGLEARFNGKRDFVTRLAAAVMESHSASPAKLRNAAQQGNMSELAFVAHSLKGVAGNLMAGSVWQLANEADQAARAASPAAAELGLRLAQAVEQLLAAMTLRVSSGTKPAEDV